MVAEILKALEEKWQEVVKEETAKSPEFKEVWESLLEVPRRVRDLEEARLPEVSS